MFGYHKSLKLDLKYQLIKPIMYDAKLLNITIQVDEKCIQVVDLLCKLITNMQWSINMINIEIEIKLVIH